MKINEILTESSELDEAPMGFVNRGMRKLGTGVVSRIPGMKNVAYGMQQGIAAGDMANQLYKELYGLFGRTGDSFNDVTGDYLAGFVRSQGFNPFDLKGKIPLGKSGIEQALLKVVQNNSRPFKKPTIATPAAPIRPASSPVGSPTPAVPNAKMSYGQVKQAAMGLKPGERSKLIAALQAQPIVRPKVKKTAV